MIAMVAWNQMVATTTQIPQSLARQDTLLAVMYVNIPAILAPIKKLVIMPTQ
tara:strand:- start:327 stop:482 length:156 start_codon:yes stop_codon:yes gene_type:complete